MITFEIGGRKVSPKSFGDAIAAAALESIKKQVEDKVKKKLTSSELRDVKITMKGRDISSLSITVDGSEEVIAKVKAALGVK